MGASRLEGIVSQHVAARVGTVGAWLHPLYSTRGHPSFDARRIPTARVSSTIIRLSFFLSLPFSFSPSVSQSVGITTTDDRPTTGRRQADNRPTTKRERARNIDRARELDTTSTNPPHPPPLRRHTTPGTQPTWELRATRDGRIPPNGCAPDSPVQNMRPASDRREIRPCHGGRTKAGVPPTCDGRGHAGLGGGRQEKKRATHRVPSSSVAGPDPRTLGASHTSGRQRTGHVDTRP